MSITVTLSHDKNTLEALRDEWIDLQARSSATGIMLTWQWISIWYKHFEHFGELWILTAREGHRLIGIAPMMKVKKQPDRGLAWRQIEFIGASYDHENLDFIIEPGYEKQLITLFMEKLDEHKSQWDVISLTGLNDTQTIDILQQLDNDWVENPGKNIIVPCLTLPDTMDEWMSSVSHRRRKKLRRYPRKLDDEYPDQWSMEQVNQPDELNEIFDKLVSLHQTYWEEQGEFGFFYLDEEIAYYRELAHCMLENGWLRLHHLDIEGKPCAIDLCYHYRGRAYAQIGGVDRDVMSNITIGDVLMHYNIEQAIDEGLNEYSFMVGEQPYKYSFGGVKRVQKAFRLIRSPRVRLQLQTIDMLRAIKLRMQGAKSQILEKASDVPTDKDDES